MANIINNMIMINSKSSSLLSSHLTTSSRAYAVLAAGHDHSLIPMMQSHHYSHSPSPASASESEMPRTASSGEYLAPAPPPPPPLPPAARGGMKKAAAKQEVFWMRDPKTGNWIPENHLYGGDHHHHHLLDAAVLRAKLLSNNQHNHPL